MSEKCNGLNLYDCLHYRKVMVQAIVFPHPGSLLTLLLIMKLPLEHHQYMNDSWDHLT